ncbi:MAG: hypothetical protein ACOCVG_04215 [Verrucomicrobiota bacterium]
MPELRRICVTMENGHCRGHFPGHPIVPGAVMVKWLLAALEAQTGRSASAWRVQRLKLLRELSPGAEVELHLEAQAKGWQGTLSDASDTYASMFFSPVDHG